MVVQTADCRKHERANIERGKNRTTNENVYLKYANSAYGCMEHGFIYWTA